MNETGVSLSLSLSTFRCCLSPSISIYLKSCVISAGTSSCFRGVFWRQQGARGKGSLSSLLRPHTKLTNSNSNGDRFWPIARKLPWRWIATDPTNARTGGGECSTHARALAGRRGRFEEQFLWKGTSACVRALAQKSLMKLKGHRKISSLSYTHSSQSYCYK